MVESKNIKLNPRIKDIRAVAQGLLDIEVKRTDIDFIVSHPFTNSIFVGVKGEFVNVLEEPDKWKKFTSEKIKEADLLDLLLMIIPPYQLLFINLIESALSDKELGELIDACWQGVEDISGDVNVSGKDLVKLLKRADKSTLMEQDELDKFNSLPDVIILYRGVTTYNKNRKKAMSWTDDKEKALWFANRFKSDEKELWTITVPKSQILACFNYENEFIVDMFSTKIKVNVEVL